MPFRILVVLINVGWTALVSVFYPYFGVLILVYLNFGRPQDDRPNIEPYHIPMIMVIAVLLGTVFRIGSASKPMLAGIKRLWLVCILYLLYGLSALANWTALSSNRVYEISILMMLCFLTMTWVTTEKRLAGYMNAILFSGAWVILSALRNPTHIREEIGGQQFDRMSIAKGSTVFGNSNYLALFMVMTIFVSIAMFTLYKKLWQRLILLVIAGSAGYVFFRANSRGATMALAIGLFITWLVNGKKGRNALIGLVLVGVCALAAPQSYWDRLSTVVHYQEDASATGRLELWDVALRLIGEYPVLGVGPDNFTRYASNTPHNAYLQVGSELGIFALLIYIAMLLSALYAAWDARRLTLGRDGPSQVVHAAALGTFLCVLAVIVQGFTTGLAHREVVYVFVTLSFCCQMFARRQTAEVTQAVATDEFVMAGD